MSTIKNKVNREEGLSPKLRSAVSTLVNRLGASQTLLLLDKAATSLDINSYEDPISMGFLVQEIACGVEDIPHWSGKKVVVTAHGIRPEDGILFVTAACDDNRQITWYARPININGTETTEFSRNWYEDGRDRV
ncbi:hypothetical protein [Paenibacillus polymyxa]|uniref:hypothetical protein n=1 Tax=Paenibacillus polymyxa TaxID=1406 RepID=UPI0008460743|nr:hypothetical protein [Paenibacillus polymyxa]AOK91977.1 hypothetical protein AOU00_20440 [Paenibacillus polymyxa]